MRRCRCTTGHWTNPPRILQGACMHALDRCALNPAKFLHKKGTLADSFYYKIWLGLQDSNLRMTGPKPVALPLGEGPTLYIY